MGHPRLRTVVLSIGAYATATLSLVGVFHRMRWLIGDLSPADWGFFITVVVVMGTVSAIVKDRNMDHSARLASVIDPSESR